MTEAMDTKAYGALVEPATLKIERLLPGSVERVWAYLTDDGLRRRWLAAGAMDVRKGAPFELVWRNDDLTRPPGARPEGFPAEQRMRSRVIEVDPPRRLVIAWDEGDVAFDLAPEGDAVRLTVLHRRLNDRRATIMTGAGWHMHLDILAALAAGRTPPSFWDGWVRLREDYERLIPA